jgi:hypothetical protein
MRLVLAAVRAELLELYTLRCCSFVLCLAVVPILAFAALELDYFSCHTAFPFLLKVSDRA